MARKKTNKSKEVEYRLNNIESIMEVICEKIKSDSTLVSIRKYDGITIEFGSINEEGREHLINIVKNVVIELGLKNYVIEKRKDSLINFILQFPDMNPEYTEEEIETMYKSNFKWLLDDSLANKPDLTKKFIQDHTENYVKLAVTTFYRSNVNQYKVKLDDLLSDYKMRAKLNVLFLTYLDEYWEARNK